MVIFFNTEFTVSAPFQGETEITQNARADLLPFALQALPDNGLNGPVLAFAFDRGKPVHGGLFTRTYDLTMHDLGYVARFNTTTNTWQALPNKGFRDFRYTGVYFDGGLR